MCIQTTIYNCIRKCRERESDKERNMQIRNQPSGVPSSIISIIIYMCRYIYIHIYIYSVYRCWTKHHPLPSGSPRHLAQRTNPDSPWQLWSSIGQWDPTRDHGMGWAAVVYDKNVINPCTQKKGWCPRSIAKLVQITSNNSNNCGVNSWSGGQLDFGSRKAQCWPAWNCLCRIPSFNHIESQTQTASNMFFIMFLPRQNACTGWHPFSPNHLLVNQLWKTLEAAITAGKSHGRSVQSAPFW